MVKDRKIRILVLTQMVVIAILAVSIPALIITFQREYNFTIAQSSIIPIIGTISGFITNIIMSSISAKMGLKRLNIYFLIIGFFASVILAFSHSTYLFLFGIMLAGITIAFGLTNISTIFAHLDKKYQNYGVFHAFFGVGGIIAPAIISFLISHSLDYRYIYYLLTGIFFGLIIFVFFSKLIENKKYENIKLREAVTIIGKKFVLPVLVLLALQGGLEQGVVTWSGNLLHDAFDYSLESASLYLSAHWVLFTLSRLLIQHVENKLGKLGTAKLCATLAMIFILLLILTGKPIFFAFLAIPLSGIFPIMQKYSAQKLPAREVGLFNGMAFAFVGIGNFIISGSMGLVADSSLKLAYTIPILSALLILVILFYLTKLKRMGIVKKT